MSGYKNYKKGVNRLCSFVNARIIPVLQSHARDCDPRSTASCDPIRVITHWTIRSPAVATILPRVTVTCTCMGEHPV